MEYITHVILGILATFVGFLPPGMLNMTAVQLTIERGVKQSQLFSLGASFVVFLQASIALFFAKKLNSNPELLVNFEVAGIVVFFALSILFFMKTRSKFKFKSKKDNKNNFFFRGILMALMNMLAIPFYLGVSSYFVANDWLQMDTTSIILFVFGTALGAYMLFITYIVFAKIIIVRANFIARNINYILSVLFLVLGILTWVK